MDIKQLKSIIHNQRLKEYTLAIDDKSLDIADERNDYRRMLLYCQEQMIELMQENIDLKLQVMELEAELRDCSEEDVKENDKD